MLNKRFGEIDINEKVLQRILNNNVVRKVKIYVLGPEGTNISQAAIKWAKLEKISQKTELIFCTTPEEEIEKAMMDTENGSIPIFALCAVYYNLNKLFFKYTDNYFFLSHYYMKLDSMQLASKKYVWNTLPKNASIASHLSPAPLISDQEYVIIPADSNAQAALKCYRDEVDACITTERARKIYGLQMLYLFGSPYMLFTFGTTSLGIKKMQKILQGEK